MHAVSSTAILGLSLREAADALGSAAELLSIAMPKIDG
jgi:hypothetical protein